MNAELALVGSVIEARTPEQWAEIVRDDLGKAVAGLVAAGAHLLQAKAQIQHGEWLPWIDRELPIGLRGVQMLMRIAEHPVLANAIHGSHLPPSLRSLDVLARLEAPLLEAAIAEGRIHPELERKQAMQLVTEYEIRNRPRPVTHIDERRGGVEEPGPEAPPERICTIVADPPWRYGNTSTRGAAADHYPTMTIEELCDLDVARERAADQAHLYLWTTSSHLPGAFSVMEAWGFTYKTYLVWIKPQMGMGNYFRVSTELVLFGVKGGLRTQDMGIMNYFTQKRGRHSSKPSAFYDLVCKASRGPYLEMFARCDSTNQLADTCQCSRCRLGWEVWGNQA